MELFQFLAIIRARRRDVLVVLGSCIIGSLLISLCSPKEYSATASVVVSSASDPVGGTNAGNDMADVMETQTDIVTSMSVAERVIEMLRMDRDPVIQHAWRSSTGGRGDYMGWLSANLLKHVHVAPPHGSNVIAITVHWHNAKEAATIANAFAQAYIQMGLQLKVQPAKQYAAWFDKQARALRADLEAKQKLLSDYEEKGGILATDEHVDVELARLSQLSTELVAVQNQRQEAQSRELQATRDAGASPEILQSPLIADLKTQLSAAEAKEQSLSVLMDANHPQYRRAAAEVNALRDRLSAETDKIIRSVRNAKADAVQHERELIAAIEQQKAKVADIKRRREHAALLQGDVATAQRNLDAVSQGLAQTSLESQVRQANLAQLTRATEPSEASSPQYLLNLLIGVLLGGALGVLMALWREKIDRRVRTDAELRELCGVPLLATLHPHPARSGPIPQLVSLFIPAGLLGNHATR